MKKEAPGEMELERELDALYRKVAGPDQREEGSGPEPPPKPEEEEPGKPVEGRGTGKARGPVFRVSRGLAGAVLFLLAFGLTGLFLWPTLYHYGALNLGGEVYPLRVNRLTGDVAYFDGMKWMKPPLIPSFQEPVPGNPKVHTPAPVPSEAKGAPSGMTAGPSAVAAHRVRGGYAIQIKAFPENEKKAALSFADSVREALPDIDVETVHVPGLGVWHRILSGHYESVREASGILRKSRLMNTYPGSFVQRRSRT